MTTALEDDPRADLAPAGIRLDNPRRDENLALLHRLNRFRDDFEDVLSSGWLRPKQGPDWLQERSAAAQHTEILQLTPDEDLGTRLGTRTSRLMADGTLVFVERNAVDRRKRRDVDPSIAAHDAVYLKLREFQYRWLGNALWAARTDDIQAMRRDGFGSHPKLVRQISAPDAVIPVAVRISGRRHAEAHNDRNRNQQPLHWNFRLTACA
jgi:hypothetical protein